MQKTKQITVRITEEQFDALQKFDEKPSQVIRTMIDLVLPNLK